MGVCFVFFIYLLLVFCFFFVFCWVFLFCLFVVVFGFFLGEGVLSKININKSFRTAQKEQFTV